MKKLWWMQNGPLRDKADDGNDGGGDGSGGNGKPDDKKSKIKLGDDEYEENDLKSAASLYKALQDPETGKEIIETLAKRAGLLDKDGDLKRKDGETKKQAESRFGKKLLSKLGKDYEKFAEAVGPVFDEAVKEFLEEHLGEQRAENNETTWNKTVDKFTEQYVTTPKIEEVMKELIEETPPNWSRKGFDPDRYIRRMYRMACEEVNAEPKEKGTTKGSSRGRSSDGDIPDFVVRERPKNLSLDEAIEAAMKGIRFERRD